MRVTRFGLGLMFIGACLGRSPRATRPAPASTPPAVGPVDPSKTSTLPIYVLDGKIVPPSALEGVNPNDVASVTILKNEDAVAAYGEQARAGVVVITLVPPHARAKPCRAPTPGTPAVASIVVADLVGTEPYTEQIRVDSHRRSWPMVRLLLKVLHGWKRNPLVSDTWHEGDTLILNVAPEEDPELPTGTRVLVYLEPVFQKVTTQSGNTTLTTLEDAGTLQLFPCHSLKRFEDAQSEVTLLGRPEWRVP